MYSKFFKISLNYNFKDLDQIWFEEYLDDEDVETHMANESKFVLYYIT